MRRPRMTLSASWTYSWTLNPSGIWYGLVGERDRADALNGEEPHVFTQVTVRDHVEPTGGEPEMIRIDFAPSGAVARG